MTDVLPTGDLKEGKKTDQDLFTNFLVQYNDADSWDAANFDGCGVISLQCRGGTRQGLLVNSLLEVLLMSMWFYFMGNHWQWRALGYCCCWYNNSFFEVWVTDLTKKWNHAETWRGLGWHRQKEYHQVARVSARPFNATATKKAWVITPKTHLVSLSALIRCNK